MSLIKIFNTKISYLIILFWIIGFGILYMMIFSFNLNTTIVNNWTSNKSTNNTLDVDDILLKSGELNLGNNTVLVNLSLIKENNNIIPINGVTDKSAVYQAILNRKIETANQKIETKKTIKTKPSVRFLPLPE